MPSLTRRSRTAATQRERSSATLPASDASPLALRFRARNLERVSPKRRRTLLMTRLLNVVVAVVAIVITLPLMALIALAVRLTSRGPVIFTQPRVGIDRRRRDKSDPVGAHRRASDMGGRIFTIYKFRTMTYTSDAAQTWASKNDARVTSIGRFLRATRLDELPQFFNVLKGDMNIVGPRPEQPQIFAELRAELSDYPDRQRVLPGITGWAQVNLGYDATLEDVKKKVELDLEYIGQRSPGKDLVIMAKTMPVMVLRKGSR